MAPPKAKLAGTAAVFAIRSSPLKLKKTEDLSR
jgi:hypothetical protein